MSGPDHFSRQSADYARYRPTCPDTLFQFLARTCLHKELAWDCATGNVQAAVGLAHWFDHVIATDASAAQIEKARQRDNIEYRVAPAEASGLISNTADLILVAQALHWFDLDAFFNEARRVLKKDGVLAVVSYRLARIETAIDTLIDEYHTDILGEFWPEERYHVDTAYRDIPFPLREIPCPEIRIEHDWTLDQLLGYLGSWSAVGYYRDKNGSDPLEEILSDLSACWSPVHTRKRVCWPLTIRVGKFEC